MAQEIKFGTDGWRGIIADDFTFDNVRRVAGAIASYVLKFEDAQNGIFIGYDTRFASRVRRESQRKPRRCGHSREARGRLHSHPRSLVRGEKPERRRRCRWLLPATIPGTGME